MKSQLIEDLLQWDGKHTDYLIDVYTRNAITPSFYKDLIVIISDQPKTQVASTWLIKHHYDQKNQLPDILITELLKSCDLLEEWGAKLHILQILPKVTIADNCLNAVDLFVRKCIKDKQKFVRAWGYQGLYEVSKSIPEYTDELKAMCNKALETESAAVKVRLRKILTLLNKTK